MALSFRYLAPAARLHAGDGALAQLAPEVRRAGAQRAFVVASSTVARTTSLVRQVVDALGELCAGVYDGAVRESPLPSVMAGVEAARNSGADLIVAVGGGSAIVTARAMTIVLGEGKSVEEMYTRHEPGKPPLVYRANAPKLPNIVVPTTPTTGTDRGGAAVYDDHPPHRKELYDPKTRPLAVLADPAALLSAPLSLYLDTSLTTFAGLVDAVQAPDPSPLAAADNRQGLEICLAYLPQLLERPGDSDIRLYLFAAAVLANRASQSTYNVTGRGRTTSMDRTLRYRYPHIGQGASNAVLLPTLLRLNADITTPGQARLAEHLGVRRPGMTEVAAAGAAARYLEAFFRSLGVATRLRDLGTPREDFAALAEQEAASPAYGQGLNRISDVAALLELLETAW